MPRSSGAANNIYVNMTTYLDKIIAHHRLRASQDFRSSHDLMSRAMDAGSCRGFKNALLDPGVSIIAEIKRRSPSKGELNVSLDPVLLAKTYEGSGARCISVLTDSEFFGGSLGDLCQVHRAVQVPLLRKDFTVSVNDIFDARIAGADAVLLIVAALSLSELEEFHGVAREVGLDVLVEVHDSVEAQTAVRVGAELIGINQRDLSTFEVDAGRGARLVGELVGRAVLVCESGINSRVQMQELKHAGFNAALMGEVLVRSLDPGGTLASLAAAGRGD